MTASDKFAKLVKLSIRSGQMKLSLRSMLVRSTYAHVGAKYPLTYITVDISINRDDQSFVSAINSIFIILKLDRANVSFKIV